MKKNISILFLFLCSALSYSQKNESPVEKDSIIWIRQTCELGTQTAKTDFNNGIYNAYSYGLLLSNESEKDFSDFYKKYMREKYAINMEHRGCVITDYSTCYSGTMYKLIYQKFGSRIFKKSRREAKKLFLKK
jgi:hypothetical protein